MSIVELSHQFSGDQSDNAMVVSTNLIAPGPTDAARSGAVVAHLQSSSSPTYAPMGEDIRAARKARGWSVPRLIYALNEQAWREGLRLMTNASLKTSISRWENGRVRPDEFHSRLLAQVLGLSSAMAGAR